ncbi:hypothetical protein IF2G_08051 [Cordyceps javanica]|nr:hypothetical protein IF2G_08051 [Cordyceps javanica]
MARNWQKSREIVPSVNGVSRQISHRIPVFDHAAISVMLPARGGVVVMAFSPGRWKAGSL